MSTGAATEPKFPVETLKTFYTYLFIEALYLYTESKTKLKSKFQLGPLTEDLGTTLMEHMKTISLSYSDITEKVRNDVDKERNEILRRMRDMSNEARRSEQMMEKNAMGDWDARNIHQYNTKRYDKEIGKINREAEEAEIRDDAANAEEVELNDLLDEVDVDGEVAAAEEEDEVGDEGYGMGDVDGYEDGNGDEDEGHYDD